MSDVQEGIKKVQRTLMKVRAAEGFLIIFYMEYGRKMAIWAENGYMGGKWLYGRKKGYFPDIFTHLAVRLSRRSSCLSCLRDVILALLQS